VLTKTLESFRFICFHLASTAIGKGVFFFRVVAQPHALPAMVHIQQ
jgi:hypothetical protein